MSNLDDLPQSPQAVSPLLPGYALPGVSLVIGTDGVIRFSYANPDYTVRLHPELLLAAVRVDRK